MSFEETKGGGGGQKTGRGETLKLKGRDLTMVRPLPARIRKGGGVRQKGLR